VTVSATTNSGIIAWSYSWTVGHNNPCYSTATTLIPPAPITIEVYTEGDTLKTEMGEFIVNTSFKNDDKSCGSFSYKLKPNYSDGR
jgi:hypothetical protein